MMASPHNVRRTLPLSIKKRLKQFTSKLGGTNYWQYALLLVAATMLFGYIRSSVQKNWTAKAIANVDTKFAAADIAAATDQNAFTVKVGLDKAGFLTEDTWTLQPGHIYEVLVKKSRLASYYIQPTRCDASVKYYEGNRDSISALRDFSADLNRVRFRPDGNYTSMVVIPDDHSTEPIVIRFKVVPDDHVDGVPWSGRPMTPNELARYSGQRR